MHYTDEQLNKIVEISHQQVQDYKHLEVFDNGKVEFIRFDEQMREAMRNESGSVISSTPFVVGLHTEDSLNPVQWVKYDRQKCEWSTTTDPTDNIWYCSPSNVKVLLKEINHPVFKVAAYASDVHSHARKAQVEVNEVMEGVS